MPTNYSFTAETGEPDSVEMTGPAADSGGRRLCVLGTGDFGRAIAKRAVTCGYSVTMGARSKDKRPDMLKLIEATGAKLKTQLDAIASAEMVVVAISSSFYDSLPLQALSNKVLIDVSNSNTGSGRTPSLRSNAERLQELVPSAIVVKSFNLLSAYLLESGGIQGSKELPVATDSDRGRQMVTALIRDLGFSPVDMGPLRMARDIERMPLEFFTDWRGAATVVGTIFIVFYIFNVFKFQFCKNLTVNKTWQWEPFKDLLMTTFNRNLAVVALTVLGAIYLPGVIAGYIQLYRGTKYSRFPGWLDRWLRMRKQMGLLMLAMGAVHGCISLGIYHPHHQYDWLFGAPKIIRTEVQVNGTYFETQPVDIWYHRPNWRGELFLTTGALSLCLVAILGIGSLPSVTARLTWREFTFIQSKLGWSALLVASVHDAVLGWKFMLVTYNCYMPTGLQMALYLPTLCVVGKAILLLPPLNRRLMKIRSGWVDTAAVSPA
ncbi:Metalloreductase STEAP3 [Amphibalanus amphitrite]|uniref:Metalloreductase STEAP3 n=1 Tax=Amphibalanus amphitrite TaxID=1232801 RepID=A0A6A4X0Z4_AMPAM|nr:Metalloreductase STEAP3 [Amphibalanus amphitrite]